MNPFDVSRVTMPPQRGDDGMPDGGQHEWNWAVPLPYRALAHPSVAFMPASPRALADQDSVADAHATVGYFAALQSFLTYSFGWTRPDKGLLWWLDNNCPTEDARFELISSVWGADRTLEGYLAWLASTEPADHAAPLQRWARHVDTSPLVARAPWPDTFLAALSAAPWSGGRDPFHLGRGDHVSAPSGTPDPRRQRLLTFEPLSRRATYTSDTISGWYSGLYAAGAELPDLGANSWHVDVFVKPIGYLGDFRRSRTTGLWFSGKHRIHVVGN